MSLLLYVGRALTATISSVRVRTYQQWNMIMLLCIGQFKYDLYKNVVKGKMVCQPSMTVSQCSQLFGQQASRLDDLLPEHMDKSMPDLGFQNTFWFRT